MHNFDKEQISKEFDRQVNTLLEKGYPKEAGVTEEEFLRYVEPLKDKLKNLPTLDVDLENGHLPFVIVVKSDLISAEKMMSLTVRQGKNGVTKLYPHESIDFTVIDKVKLPEGKVYLLIDIDRGKDTLNITPEEAFRVIESRQRSPLTIDEGIAILTHYPDFLMKNNCYSLLASRHTGDQRVPAIWINSNKQPNLGWCWDRNPHTWLGSASCAKRVR